MFTALDGTLLDSTTFDAGASRPVVARLVAAGIPLVPISVMTFEEIEPLAAELGLHDAMVIEAGGAIARYVDDGWQIEACAPPADTFLDVVRTIEERSGADLLVYSALSESDAATLSGRSGRMLQASVHRRFSEPFIIESGDLDAVRKAADEFGFSIRRGRRFLHLCRQCDEGEAFTRIREELRCGVTIGLGSSAVDAEFLSRADIAIIVPGPDGAPDQELLGSLHNARIAPAPGPEGWAAAVDDAWQSIVAQRRRVRHA